VSFEHLATGEATAIKPIRARQSHDRVIFTNSDKCWVCPHWGGFSMIDFLCHVINKYGTDQRSWAQPNGVPNLQPNYVRECVERALASGNLSDAGSRLAQEYLAQDSRRMTGISG
jgi:hypothetical protein